MNFAEVLTASAYRNPESIAVRDNFGTFSYQALEAMANRVARGLRAAGIQPGDRVAMSLTTSHRFLAVYFGILKLGAVAVPLNLLLKAPDIARLLMTCRARHLIAHASDAFPDAAAAVSQGFRLASDCTVLWADDAVTDLAGVKDRRPFAELIEGPGDEPFPAVTGLADAPALVCFTSGTTGTPKGAVLTHQNELVNALQFANYANMVPGDVVFSSLSLAAGFGRLLGLSVPLAQGATLRYEERFHPVTAWNAIAGEGVTVIIAVPAMYYGLLEGAAASGLEASPALRSRLRYGVFGGAPMAQPLRERLSRVMGLRLVQGYGMTEAGGVASTPGAPLDPEQTNRLEALSGVLLRIVDDHGQEVAVGDVGEVLLAGANVMPCYEHAPEATRERFRDRWLLTGDVARKLEHGRFLVIDRKSATINRGGYKVYPAELESHIESHPGVHQAVVLAAPDERLGQEIIAYVRLTEDSDLSVEALHAWCRESLPAYAYPRRIRVVDAFPVTGTGKIDRLQLEVF